MSYKLSNAAEKDLRKIFRYTLLNFGVAQADAYLTSIDEHLDLLAATPSLAQQVNSIRKGYRRYFFQKHAIYFIEKKKHIFVVRILHQQMKVMLHLI